MPASVSDARNLSRSVSFVRWFLFFSIALAGLAGDLISKSLTYQIDAVEVIPGILRFSFVLNKGIIWGIASQGSILFLIIPALAIPLILVIFKYIHVFSGHSKNSLNLLITIAFGLIMAGALGNLYDRILFKGVRDFIDFYIINWPIFNLADVHISYGVVLIIIDVFRNPKPALTPAERGDIGATISVTDNQAQKEIHSSEEFKGQPDLPEKSATVQPDDASKSIEQTDQV